MAKKAKSAVKYDLFQPQQGFELPTETFRETLAMNETRIARGMRGELFLHNH